jgi:hypothetical protein
MQLATVGARCVPPMPAYGRPPTAVETLSRSLTTLRSERVIAFVDKRHFRIVNRGVLKAYCCR